MQEIHILHPSDAGQRLDKFLKKYFPNIPLSGIYKILRTGKVKVNRKKKDQTYKVELNDMIQFFISDEEMQSLRNDITDKESIREKKNIQGRVIDVLYEDDYLLVVNKPAGINVHPGDHKTKEVSLIEIVQDYLGHAHDSLTFRPSLVHRIDRDTSGCILIAKTKDTLEYLLDALQHHRIEKIYHTIVLGVPPSSVGVIRDKILRIENPKNEAKVMVDPLGQSAVTHYRCLGYKKLGDHDCSTLECRIETGRTHQIRVHLSHIGIPVLGDKAYGKHSVNSYARRNYGITRQLLHARQLSFIHPVTKKSISIQAPFPSDFRYFQV